jgi:hypothetical protein
MGDPAVLHNFGLLAQILPNIVPNKKLWIKLKTHAGWPEMPLLLI